MNLPPSIRKFFAFMLCMTLSVALAAGAGDPQAEEVTDGFAAYIDLTRMIPDLNTLFGLTLSATEALDLPGLADTMSRYIAGLFAILSLGVMAANYAFARRVNFMGFDGSFNNLMLCFVTVLAIGVGIPRAIGNAGWGLWVVSYNAVDERARPVISETIEEATENLAKNVYNFTVTSAMVGVTPITAYQQIMDAANNPSADTSAVLEAATEMQSMTVDGEIDRADNFSLIWAIGNLMIAGTFFGYLGIIFGSGLFTLFMSIMFPVAFAFLAINGSVIMRSLNAMLSSIVMASVAPGLMLVTIAVAFSGPIDYLSTMMEQNSLDAQNNALNTLAGVQGCVAEAETRAQNAGPTGRWATELSDMIRVPACQGLTMTVDTIKGIGQSAIYILTGLIVAAALFMGLTTLGFMTFREFKSVIDMVLSTSSGGGGAVGGVKTGAGSMVSGAVNRAAGAGMMLAGAALTGGASLAGGAVSGAARLAASGAAGAAKSAGGQALARSASSAVSSAKSAASSAADKVKGSAAGQAVSGAAQKAAGAAGAAAGAAKGAAVAGNAAFAKAAPGAAKATSAVGGAAKSAAQSMKNEAKAMTKEAGGKAMKAVKASPKSLQSRVAATGQSLSSAGRQSMMTGRGAAMGAAMAVAAPHMNAKGDKRNSATGLSGELPNQGGKAQPAPAPKADVKADAKDEAKAESGGGAKAESSGEATGGAAAVATSGGSESFARTEVEPPQTADNNAFVAETQAQEVDSGSNAFAAETAAQEAPQTADNNAFVAETQAQPQPASGGNAVSAGAAAGAVGAGAASAAAKGNGGGKAQQTTSAVGGGKTAPASGGGARQTIAQHREAGRAAATAWAAKTFGQKQAAKPATPPPPPRVQASVSQPKPTPVGTNPAVVAAPAAPKPAPTPAGPSAVPASGQAVQGVRPNMKTHDVVHQSKGGAIGVTTYAPKPQQEAPQVSTTQGGAAAVTAPPSDPQGKTEAAPSEPASRAGFGAANVTSNAPTPQPQSAPQSAPTVQAAPEPQAAPPADFYEPMPDEAYSNMNPDPYEDYGYQDYGNYGGYEDSYESASPASKAQAKSSVASNQPKATPAPQEAPKAAPAPQKQAAPTQSQTQAKAAPQGKDKPTTQEAQPTQQSKPKSGGTPPKKKK